MLTPPRGPSRRAPGLAVTGLLLALLGVLITSPSATTLGAGWTSLKRVADEDGSRLDSLHQLAGDRGRLHLVHPRLGAGSPDRVLYQRLDDDAEAWTDPVPIFAVTVPRRDVVSNLAVAARSGVVAVAWRVKGPQDDELYVRVSRDGGRSFDDRIGVFSSAREDGIGVPSVAVSPGGRVVAVAWTDRANGKVKVRTSRDSGRSFSRVRVLGKSGLSIDCRERLFDALVGLTAAKSGLHLAWSEAPPRKCQASSIMLRSSKDGGRTWGQAVTVTARRSYGWPELDSRGDTVMATVQAPSGGVIVARSGDGGTTWVDRLLQAPKGHSFSAADVVLLARGKAMIVYVNERLRRSRLVRTKVVSRWSPDDGVTLNQPRTVVPEAGQLRMAPNIGATDAGATIVVQSGPLSGATRNLFVSRQR